MSISVAADHLRAFIERVERLEEEIKTMNSEKSEVYKEARAMGYDVKTMRKVVSARKVEPHERVGAVSEATGIPARDLRPDIAATFATPTRKPRPNREAAL